MIPGTCPRCGAGVAAEDGKPCRSERSAVYECYTSVVNDGRDYRLLQSSVCVARETPFLRARVRELEARVEKLKTERTHTDRLLRDLVVTLRAAEYAASHAEPGEAHRALVRAIEAIFAHTKEAKL